VLFREYLKAFLALSNGLEYQLFTTYIATTLRKIIEIFITLRQPSQELDRKGTMLRHVRFFHQKTEKINKQYFTHLPLHSTSYISLLG
jgi:hypothetical protein